MAIQAHEIQLDPMTLMRLLMHRFANRVPRTTAETLEDTTLTFGPNEGLSRRVSFNWERFFDQGKLGTTVQVRLAGRQCAVTLPHPAEMAEAMVFLKMELDDEVRGYQSDRLSHLLALSTDAEEQLREARSVAIELQRAPVDLQYRILATIRRWVASHEVNLWWTDAMTTALRQELATWERRPETAAIRAKKEAIARDMGQLPGLTVRMESSAARSFWKIFFATIYWEHEFDPGADALSAFLPRGGPGQDEGQPALQIFVGQADDDLVAEPNGNILANDGAVVPAEAIAIAEPEPMFEVGDPIPDADPRLQTPRAESYRKMGFKYFMEPKGPIFEGDNGYFGALGLSKLGVPVVAFDTDTSDNAAYLGYARVEGDVDATAWVDDFVKRKSAARRALRFIRRFYHVFTWTDNVIKWLTTH